MLQSRRPGRGEQAANLDEPSIGSISAEIQAANASRDGGPTDRRPFCCRRGRKATLKVALPGSQSQVGNAGASGIQGPVSAQHPGLCIADPRGKSRPGVPQRHRLGGSDCQCSPSTQRNNSITHLTIRGGLCTLGSVGSRSDPAHGTIHRSLASARHTPVPTPNSGAVGQPPSGYVARAASVEGEHEATASSRSSRICAAALPAISPVAGRLIRPFRMSRGGCSSYRRPVVCNWLVR